MNQAEVAKLMSQLKITVKPKWRHLKTQLVRKETFNKKYFFSNFPFIFQLYGEFAPGKARLDKLRKTVTALVKYERLEMNHNRADEARGYAERLISDAIRNGDRHKTTMEMADFWLLEKQLVHKLFKVLVPRYETSGKSYTVMHRAPKEYPGHTRERVVLELRGHPFPSVLPDTEKNKYFIHNVLLDEARREYMREKMKEKNAREELESRMKENETVVTTEKVEEIKEVTK